MDPVARRRELADFVRSRRERLDPLALGLPASGRRRTPGLRREEVAGLASVSVTYYTWIEQARDLSPSRQVLDALAHALRLEPLERAHLFTLAGQPPPRTEPGGEVHPTLRDLLSTMDHPAYVLDQCWDVLVYNTAAAALVCDFDKLPAGQRNMLWLVFTDPALRTLLTDWTQEAQWLLARYRVAAAEHAGHPASRRRRRRGSA